jgi:hypothetical protein
MRVDPGEKKTKQKKIKEERKRNSLNSVANVALIFCALIVKQKFSLVSAVGLLTLGGLSLVVSWIRLWKKLGVCPGVFHSTSCRPELKGEKIRFRSTRVFEFGVVNGIVDSVFWYFFIRAENSFFVFAFAGYCLFGMVFDGMEYYVTDVLAILVAFSSVFFSLDYEINGDYLNQSAVCLFFGKVFALRRFKRQLKEANSVAVVSIVTQGVVFLVYGLIWLEVGNAEDLILSVVLALLSYNFFDLVNEKTGSYYSILSLIMFAFCQEIQVFSIVLSSIGLFLNLFGFHLTSLCTTRFNIVLIHSNNTSDVSRPLI